MVDAVFGDILAGVADTSIRIVIASVKPWRYLFSESFRQKTNAQYARSNPLIKWWNLLRGFVALLLSIALVALIVLFFVSYEQAQRDRLIEHQKMLNGIEDRIIIRIINHGSNNQ
jgi:hypothetical protein